jgi:hypothetical protein
MKPLTVALALLIAYMPYSISVARADDAPVCVEPLAVTTPCSGVLLPPEAAADGLRCLRIDLPRLELKLSQADELFANYKSYSESLLSIESGHSKDLQGLLDTALESREGPSWYEHPVFWFAMGFIVAAGTTIGITYAVNDGGSN